MNKTSSKNIPPSEKSVFLIYSMKKIDKLLLPEKVFAEKKHVLVKLIVFFHNTQDQKKKKKIMIVKQIKNYTCTHLLFVS